MRSLVRCMRTQRCAIADVSHPRFPIRQSKVNPRRYEISAGLWATFHSLGKDSEGAGETKRETNKQTDSELW